MSHRNYKISTKHLHNLQFVRTAVCRRTVSHSGGKPTQCQIGLYRKALSYLVFPYFECQHPQQEFCLQQPPLFISLHTTKLGVHKCNMLNASGMPQLLFGGLSVWLGSKSGDDNFSESFGRSQQFSGKSVLVSLNVH